MTTTETKLKPFTLHPHEIRRGLSLKPGETGQFRRIVEPQPVWIGQGARMRAAGVNAILSYPGGGTCSTSDSPFQPGDVLVIKRRGQWQTGENFDYQTWSPEFYIRIADVRVQRVREISEEDAIAEGVAIPTVVKSFNRLAKRERYRYFWSSLHGPDSWEQNPFVWVGTYERCDDELAEINDDIAAAERRGELKGLRWMMSDDISLSDINERICELEQQQDGDEIGPPQCPDGDCKFRNGYCTVCGTPEQEPSDGN